MYTKFISLTIQYVYDLLLIFTVSMICDKLNQKSIKS